MRETRWSSWLQFARAAASGSLATIADLIALATLVEWAHVPVPVANLVALFLGAVIQFFGCRGPVFRAESRALASQLGGFIGVEIGALALNAAAFQILYDSTALPYMVIRMVSGFAIFAFFSFPLWRIVFGRAR